MKPAELDQLRVQLAGCLTAAEGHISDDAIATKEMYGWSPAYEAVLQLRRKYEELHEAAEAVIRAYDGPTVDVATAISGRIPELRRALK